MDLPVIKVPAHVLYGVETARCLENLTCSSHKLSDCPELIEALALVKKAAALSNRDAGVIEDSVCQAICLACDEIASHKHDENFPVDMLHGGGSIAFNQNMNEVLATLASRRGTAAGNAIDPKKHVNASQSTADACSTAFRIAVLSKTSTLLGVLSDVEATLECKSKEYTAMQTVARTCLQDAMPVAISSMFSAWKSAICRRRGRIESARNQMHKVNLGGTVIGDGSGATPEYRRGIVRSLCSVSGLPFTQREDLFDAAQNSDDLGEVSAAVCQLAEVLIKICSDLRLLSSGPDFGFAELSLPAVQNGSSFFSNKNNPVVPETVLQACFHVLGNHRAAQAALEHAELNLNVFESGIFFHLFQSLEVMNASLVLLNEKCLNGLTVNGEKCIRMVQQFQQKKHV